MMTPPAAPPRRAALAPALLLTLAIADSGCASMAKRSYPPPSADARVDGLKAAVTIYLDGRGVPHIYAESNDDAAFAVGYMHARDRRFQIELLRLVAQGRLSELLGEDVLDIDRRMRLLTWNNEERFASLPPVDRERLAAYSAGVNAATTALPRPVEFRLLRYEPEPWTAMDSAAIGVFQAWRLSADVAREAALDRALAAARAPSEWLIAYSQHHGQPIVNPDDQPGPPVPDLPLPPPIELADAPRSPASPAPAGPATAELARRRVAALARGVVHWAELPRDGSNAWALAPSRTSDGQAILATDPHLALPWPAVFYEAHYTTPTLDVSGATFPGMPMVVIGKTPYVAWGVTTSYADAQDLYTLEVDPQDRTRYRLDGAWRSFEPWPQTFRWGKDKRESRTELYRVSHFGPVYNSGREGDLAPGKTYALHWYGMARGDVLAIAAPFEALAMARTPDDVERAIRSLPSPSQSWTYATADGHIGYVLGGTLQVRRASPVPRDGTRSDSLKLARLPERERPALRDPPSGIIVASNQPVHADVSRFNTYTSGPYRALRIASTLASRPRWSRAEMRALQLDIANLEAARVLPVVLAAVNTTPATHHLTAETRARVDAMLQRLRAWDFQMRADAVAPLIYESIRGHLHDRLLRPHIPDEGARHDYMRSRLSEPLMEAALFDARFAGRWDDPVTAETELLGHAVWDAVLAAERELSARFGKRVETWRWGQAHTLVLKHPFSGEWYLRALFGPELLPLAGGRHCVNSLDHAGVLGDYTSEDGPALRQVVSPGVEPGFALPGGNAGQPGHPHATDQLDEWVHNRQHVYPASRDALAAAAEGVITLAPTQAATARGPHDAGDSRYRAP